MSTEHPLFNFSQEAVMDSYRRGRAFKNKCEEGVLHMFFSPNRVPLGLTNTQIRVCLSIANLKRDQERINRELALSQIPEELRYTDEELYEEMVWRARIKSIYPHQLLPQELICTNFITEERFNAGIIKFLASL